MLLRWISVVAALFLMGAACTESEDQTDNADIAFDVGVTSEPCPEAEHPERGCIYLGVLSDLTEGPFVALAVPVTEGQEAFWDRMNANGGIGGRFDVDISTYTRDNKYNPEDHVAKFREIEPHILALAQSLGTPTTLAALDLYEDANVVAIPATWWSGWAFEDRILESGYSYCIEAMNGLDWAAEEFGAPATVMAVHYPGDFGDDSAAGVRIWAESNGVSFDARDHDVQTLPNAQAGNQDAVVQALLRARPDVVVLATGPTEMAEIVGRSAARGFTGRFVGSIATYNQAVLESDAEPAITELYNFVAPWGPWGSETQAHEAMLDATGGTPPANDGFTWGWIWSYPMKALLERAVENEDLTREGLASAVEEITVDYEGALPPRTYGGDPADSVVKNALIARPDAGAPLGASVLDDFFVGPTARDFELTEPCSQA